MNGAVLVIDSASDAMVVAFAPREGEPVLEVHIGAQDHSQMLLQMVNTVAAGRKDRLEAIVVVRGPGGYSGIRVGLATAEGLSLALGIPVAGVGTLEAVDDAARYTGAAGRLVAIHPAGRGDYATQAFPGDSSAGEMALVHGDDLGSEPVAGEGAGAFDGIEIGPEQRCLAAARLYRAGRASSADAVYVREPHITLPRKRPANDDPGTPG